MNTKRTISGHGIPIINGVSKLMFFLKSAFSPELLKKKFNEFVKSLQLEPTDIDAAYDCMIFSDRLPGNTDFIPDDMNELFPKAHKKMCGTVAALKESIIRNKSESLNTK